MFRPPIGGGGCSVGFHDYGPGFDLQAMEDTLLGVLDHLTSNGEVHFGLGGDLGAVHVPQVPVLGYRVTPENQD